MRLSDIVGASGLVSWAEAGFLSAVVAVGLITIYTFAGRNRSRFEQARFMPLVDDDPVLRKEDHDDDA
ncbi:MAG: hypothetical protein Q9Q40_08130 [Acidobacteriota bacterium]|nr:hypothetical protein [Acidobacteriota bacterium]MDQ7086679.1 hypothetical protein [Acidobacteriota bacterium]